ncbi:membrane protein [Acidobacteria bacterium Mor1]|nr:membrane protein [Acidobacteria bacterium Mor1]
MLILAVLGLNIAISEWLARHTWLRHLGSALLVILLTAVTANIGLIPTYSSEVAIYGVVFSHVAPLAIFLLLLQVNLRGILRAGVPMLGMFFLGALGTVCGVMAGMAAVGGAEAFGDLHWALGGMFTGTYIGGSINYNAVALEYEVVKEAGLYAGAAAVDSAATAVWMAVTVALPRLLGRRTASSERKETSATPAVAGAEVSPEMDTETVGPFDVALLMALGSAGVWLSDLIAAWTGAPSVLILTTLALGLAQLPPVQALRGTRLTGWLTVMLFLAVIGALCDLHALAEIGPLALRLILFVTVILTIHGLVVFGGGRLLRLDPELSAVASQANIGGSTSALALARSLGRGDLVLPAILLGALGNGVGTYLGFLVAAWLR